MVSLLWMEGAVLGGGDVRKISNRAGALLWLLELHSLQMVSDVHSIKVPPKTAK